MFIALHPPPDIALLRSAMFELNRGYKHLAPPEQSYRVTAPSRSKSDFEAERRKLRI